jgi:hypothetical protein
LESRTLAILILTTGIFIGLISSPSFNSLSNNYAVYHYQYAAAATKSSSGSNSNSGSNGDSATSTTNGGGEKSSPPDKKSDSSSSPSPTAVPDNSNPTTTGDKKDNTNNNNKDTTTCPDGTKPIDTGKCKTQLQPHPDDDCLFNPSLNKCKSIDEQCPKGFFLNDDDNCVPDKKCPKGFETHAQDETGTCYPVNVKVD